MWRRGGGPTARVRARGMRRRSQSSACMRGAVWRGGRSAPAREEGPGLLDHLLEHGVGRVGRKRNEGVLEEGLEGEVEALLADRPEGEGLLRADAPDEFRRPGRKRGGDD